MTPKQYLQQIQKLDWLIEQKTDELNKIQNAVTGIRGIDYSADRVQHSADSNGMESVERMVDDSRKLQNDIASLVGQRNKIVRRIQRMDNRTYSQLLYLRYVQRKRLDKISKEMGYTENYIKELHGKALRAFSQKYKIH